MRKLWLIIRIFAYAVVLFNALLGHKLSMFTTCLMFSIVFVIQVESKKTMR